MIARTFVMDTSFYGNLLLEPDKELLISKMKSTKTIFIIGIDVIEKELFETPAHVRYRGEATRKVLLTLFDFLVDEVVKLPPIAAYLAEEYFQAYRKHAKNKKLLKYGEENLKTDFQIIALASLRSVDVVVSADKRTMLSELAKKVYGSVNAKNGLRTPELVDYTTFKETYLPKDEEKREEGR